MTSRKNDIFLQNAGLRKVNVAQQLASGVASSRKDTGGGRKSGSNLWLEVEKNTLTAESISQLGKGGKRKRGRSRMDSLNSSVGSRLNQVCSRPGKTIPLFSHSNERFNRLFSVFELEEPKHRWSFY